MTVFKNALVIQRKSDQPESTTAVLSIERQIPSPSPSPDPLTPRGGPVKWKDYGDGRCYCRWEIGDCTKVGRGSRWVGIKGRGGGGIPLVYQSNMQDRGGGRGRLRRMRRKSRLHWPFWSQVFSSGQPWYGEDNGKAWGVFSNKRQMDRQSVPVLASM